MKSITLIELARLLHKLEKREEVTKELKAIQHTYYSGLWHDLKNNHLKEEKNLKKINQQKNEAEKLFQEKEEIETLRDVYKQLIKPKNSVY